jgi:tetrahydromethanopterin S-methyltransferase subunit G
MVRWFNWLGVGMQVVGLIGAIYLLARLKEDVTRRQVLVLHWLRRLRIIALRLVGRTPAPHEVRAGISLGLGFQGRAHGVATRGPMPDGLGLDGRVAWVEEYVRDLERKHNELSSEVWRQAGAQEASVRDARRHAEEEISKAVADVRSEVRQLIGQDVGWEILALFVIVVGIALAALP